MINKVCKIPRKCVHTYICMYIYMCCCCLVANSCLSLLGPPWTVACQAPLSLGFPRKEYWSRFAFPSPVYLPDPGMETASPALAGRFFTTEPPGKPPHVYIHTYILIYIYTHMDRDIPLKCFSPISQ